MIQATNIISINPPRPPSGLIIEADETISITPPSTDNKIPSCELVINDKQTGQRIAGCVLEAAFQCDMGYLIFLTEDCPFEESLDIHLVGLTGTLLDSARIGGMYTTGTFGNIQIHQPDTLFFDFIDKTAHKTGTTWIIKILPQPTARIPFLYGILGISRPFKFKQYFSIKFAPRTEPR